MFVSLWLSLSEVAGRMGTHIAVDECVAGVGVQVCWVGGSA